MSWGPCSPLGADSSSQHPLWLSWALGHVCPTTSSSLALPTRHLLSLGLSVLEGLPQARSHAHLGTGWPKAGVARTWVIPPKLGPWSKTLWGLGPSHRHLSYRPPASGAVVLDVACFAEAERLYMLVRDTAVRGRPLTALVLPEVLVSGAKAGLGLWLPPVCLYLGLLEQSPNVCCKASSLLGMG